MHKIVFNVGFAFLIFFIVITPIAVSQKTISLNVVFAVTCPGGPTSGTPIDNGDGTFTCMVSEGGGELPVTRSIIIDSNGNVVNPGTATAYTGGPAVTVDGASTCDADTTSWKAFFSLACWPTLISGVVSGALVYVTSWILTAAGGLFNIVLTKTILQFSQFLSGRIMDAINLAWSVFRDISNIVIIGMFTFIAIATILGIENYGYKRLLSRVLIVAILINFSLLFTKIIIDVSNFTAIQFYTATGAAQADSLSVSTPDTNGCLPGGVDTYSNQPCTYVGRAPTAGIAGAVMLYTGITGFGDTQQLVTKISANQKAGAWIGLLFGVTVAILYFAAAAVLFYGAFLLSARALAFIILMFTASLAFASYLIPSLSEGSFGWSTWWSTLLKNAVFAPLLMVFLWITLMIGKAIQGSGGSLGDLIVNPTKTADIGALFGYVIVIGLLFASFRLSSSFASSVSGLSLGKGAFEKFVSTAFGGTSQLRGLLRQQTIGRWAYTRASRSEAEAKQAQADAMRAEASARTHLKYENPGLANFATNEAQRLRELAEKKARESLRYGAIADKKVGNVESYAAGIKRRSEEASKVIGKIEPSKEEQNAIRNEAEKNAIAQRQSGEVVKEAIKNASEQNLKAVEKLAEAEREKARTEVQTHEEGRDALVTRQNKEIQELTEQIAAEISADRDATKLNARLAAQKAKHVAELGEQDNRIKAAKTSLGLVEKNLADRKFTGEGVTTPTSINEAKAQVSKDVADLNAYRAETRRVAEEAKKEVGLTLAKSMASTTQEIVKKQSSWFEKAVGSVTDDNKKIAEEATKRYRGKHETERIKKAFESFTKKEEGEHAAEGGGGDHH